MNNPIAQPYDPKEEVRQILYSMGFIAKDHILLAEKLLAQPLTEAFERVIKPEKHADRERHLHTLRKLSRRVRDIDIRLDELYGICQKPGVDLRNPSPTSMLELVYAKTNRQLVTQLVRFAFNWTAQEKMAVVADYIGQKFHVWLSPAGKLPSSFVPDPECQRKVRTLEELVRMPAQDYCQACACLRTAMKAVYAAQQFSTSVTTNVTGHGVR